MKQAFSEKLTLPLVKIPLLLPWVILEATEVPLLTTTSWRGCQESVPPVTGPSEEDFYGVQKDILKLKNFEKKAREAPLRIAGRAVSFDTIELSWGSVPGAVAYQVEGRRPSDSALGKVYEGNSLSYTVTGLEPGTRYLFHLRAVLYDGAVNEWSEIIKVATQEVPVPCNITANAVSYDT